MFGPLAFRNPRFLALPEEDRWTRTSPQHIDRVAMRLLFPNNFFDATLSVVRHPVARILSIFRFQRDIETTIDQETSFGEWLTYTSPDTPWAFDNHLKPMDAIVPSEAEVFKLEDGLHGFRQRVKALAGPGAPPLPEIAPRNVLAKRLAHLGKTSQPIVPTNDDLERIGALYAVDFERFGYSLDDWTPTQ